MLIGGVQKFSLIDYPRKAAALIFTQGCGFLCHFCHNPSLVLSELFTKPFDEDEVLFFLKKRKNRLDGVVITGGEPTIQKDLKRFITKIKRMGYLVKLDTNGINPRVLKQLIDGHLIDYIAMDIKAPLDKYRLITQRDIDTDLIKESINIIISSKTDYEFRSTLVKNLHEAKDIEAMAKLIKNANLYILQTFISKNSIISDSRDFLSFTEKEMLLMQSTSQNYVKKCLIR